MVCFRITVALLAWLSVCELMPAFCVPVKPHPRLKSRVLRLSKLPLQATTTSLLCVSARADGKSIFQGLVILRGSKEHLQCYCQCRSIHFISRLAFNHALSSSCLPCLSLLSLGLIDESLFSLFFTYSPESLKRCIRIIKHSL